MQQPFATNVDSNVRQMDIQSRLAALNRWQEEQKRLLEDRQTKQRQVLSLEQRNMYQKLGLRHESSAIDDNDADGSILETQEDNQQDTALGTEQQLDIQVPRHAGKELNDFNEYEDAPTATAKPKQPYLRRGDGLKQRFKIHPDKLRINNLPRYKFANSHPQLRSPAPVKQRRSILKVRNEVKIHKNTPQNPQQPLDYNEQRFQQMLISSKNMCSSTPDLKSSYASTNTSVSPKVRFVELNSAEHVKGQSADDEQSSEASPMTGMSWARVLDTQQIKPIPMVQRRTAQIRVENDDNISFFELLEQKASEGSIDTNSSCIRAFMARKEQRTKLDDDDSDQILVPLQLREMPLQPKVCEVFCQNNKDDDENEDTVIALNSTSTLTPIQVGKTHVHVRFSDSNDTHEHIDNSTLQGSQNVQLFEQFKTALFQALEHQKTKQKPSAADESLKQDLKNQADLVRKRLEDLELEISSFKEQNTQLLRFKQKLEQQQDKYAQEHIEAMERVHDEKIQAEIYLHDERMKIEEERRKFDQQMRMQKSSVNSKDKKEVAALKQDVEALQLQLKQKEQTHVSAQARLRAQLRASEKEQRCYRDEIDSLQRENKRLEQELIKLARENNNKMLQEINRNIARLAPQKTPALIHTVEEDASEKLAKQRDTRRRHSNEINQTRSRSRSLGRAKKHKEPEPLEESYASSSSSDLNEIENFEAQEKRSKAKKSTTQSTDDNANEFKREIVNADGSKDILYPNGNLKKISADGMTVRMLYFNKDIKETDIRAGTIKYYYAETNTWHTEYLDGLQILEFPNGQTEHRHKDGRIEVHFPNNAIKFVDPSDAEKLEEWRYPDGTHVVQLRNGDKILSMPNGQKEIHTKLDKRREYPDGTVKRVFPDGSQETRYSNGRVRLKDKDGKLLMDTDYAKY